MAISTMTQFIMLIIFALTLNLLSLKAMVVLIIGFMMVFFYQKNTHFFRLMKRLKWVYLIMFLIYIFNTPGEHLFNGSYGLAATYEGLQSGLIQLLRVTLMLAALSFMLASNTVQQFISGLYFLLNPLSVIGVNVERFAARLWLTLHYVEQQQAASVEGESIIKGLGERLDDVFKEDAVENVEVTLERAVLTWLDYAAILLMLVILFASFVLRGL